MRLPDDCLRGARPDHSLAIPGNQIGAIIPLSTQSLALIHTHTPIQVLLVQAWHSSLAFREGGRAATAVLEGTVVAPSLWHSPAQGTLFSKVRIQNVLLKTLWHIFGQRKKSTSCTASGLLGPRAGQCAGTEQPTCLPCTLLQKPLIGAGGGLMRTCHEQGPF